MKTRLEIAAILLALCAACGDSQTTGIADSVRAMHSLLTSAERNQPKLREAFPLVALARDSICLTCPFFAFCGEELAEHRQTSP
jgi:hypothetical protein